MRVLGISAFYHDSAAALIEDGHLVGAAQEERFTRKKHDSGFPQNAVQYCLDAAGIKLGDVDYVAFYDKPFLKFERLLFGEHHQSHAASAFFPSPYEEAAVLCMDGVGEWATTSLGWGQGNSSRC